MANQEWVYGIHSVRSVLERSPLRVKYILVQQDNPNERYDSILALAKLNDISIQFQSLRKFDQMLPDANHQGVLAACKPVPTLDEADIEIILQKTKEPPFLLILDGVQDPHNLGACLRTADAVGVHAVIAPKDRSVGLTPTVLKVACGAAESVPFITVTNLARTMQKLKDLGVWLYGASEEATESVFSTDLTGGVGLVMGAEGEGLRRLTRENCDFLIKIPMNGIVESLNVSVASAVCMFEVVRQRGQHGRKS
ncbi:MAG: 23S rRNA (guanosine(2251)-2'-O)-methyltransferase RlmB [Proteobacteria bacterium]|nr:23S rRNA (guanosine(2251)-2'-O)-methyltransferase RlmB [Pseudomonadota bacterium]